MKRRIKAIECIQTWQGEGPDTGKSMLLLRFKECNRVEHKNPCNWCDTLVKMRVSPEAEYSAQEIQDILDDQKCGLMITGGEPTWDPYLKNTIFLLNKLKYSVANVETNGYRLIELVDKTYDDKIKYIYSPKVFQATEVDKELKTVQWAKAFPNIFIKMVFTGSEIDNLFLENILDLEINDRIYLMPQGCSRDELLRNTPLVLDVAEKFKVNISTRMHLMFEFI